MLRPISFLIGAGFSKPAGYPLTRELNERLRRIDASDICVYTNGQACFLNGQVDPNAGWMELEKRQFVQEFLEFYANRVLRRPGEFHYESFYDYYSDAIDNPYHPAGLRTFCDDFCKRHDMQQDADQLVAHPFRVGCYYPEIGGSEPQRWQIPPR
jgi:hypothetical protein